ncbi:hypothetical protein [Sphingomonas baiyangensis]|uniref:Uncharacterized protein n=1 Tax=Sphingomonas baiyangensis TaxID=2572576 RepID=A0A4U1L0H0_9SPHN|nr:hypothetical protein [Sphingomonas baiyangensis]TKD50237.1 hypothetical protein FBR43_05300 [Sphingomonas baiyangensis]
MSEELERRLRQLSERITMGANEACGEAADTLKRYREAVEAVVDAYDDASNYDMLTAQLEAAVEGARQALRGQAA